MVVRHILFVELYGTYDLIARDEHGDRQFLSCKVLMALIAERFKDLWAFETWVMQNDIQVTRTAF